MLSVRFGHAFETATRPTEEEAHAFEEVVTLLDDQLTALHAGFCPFVMQKIQPSARHCVFLSPDNILGIDNWWKHIIKERLEQDIRRNIRDNALMITADVTNFKYDEYRMRAWVETKGEFFHPMNTDNSKRSFTYEITSADRIDLYDRIAKLDGLQKVKDLCSRIGYIDVSIILNHEHPQSRAQTPTIVFESKGGPSLFDRVQQFDMFGSMH